jgi:hypothetical protein
MSYSGGSYPILTAPCSKSLKKISLPENQEAFNFVSEIKLSQRGRIRQFGNYVAIYKFV